MLAARPPPPAWNTRPARRSPPAAAYPPPARRARGRLAGMVRAGNVSSRCSQIGAQRSSANVTLETGSHGRDRRAGDHRRGAEHSSGRDEAPVHATDHAAGRSAVHHAAGRLRSGSGFGGQDNRQVVVPGEQGRSLTGRTAASPARTTTFACSTSSGVFVPRVAFALTAVVGLTSILAG